MQANLKFVILILMDSCLRASTGQNFRCFNNAGKSSTILSDAIKFAGASEGIAIPVRTGISHLSCAILCGSLGKDCQSYAYKTSTKQCYVKNVSRKIPALLCGSDANQASFKCKRSGDTFVGYVGNNYSFAECACGVKEVTSPNWAIVNSSRYKCMDSCVVSGTCFVKLGRIDPCIICKYPNTANCPLTIPEFADVVTCISAVPNYWN